MIRLATQVIRAIIPVILFQFIAPAFLPAPEVRDKRIVCFEASRVSVVSPALIKEIEPDVEWEFAFPRCHALLDFARHFDNLTSRIKHSVFWDDLVFRDHAVLYFTLYRTFRI